jgi:hypothetical protein
MNSRTTIQYTKVGSIYRPLIICTIHKLSMQIGQNAKVISLIDSGADFSVFNYELAFLTGYSSQPPLERKTLQGIKGSVEVFFYEVELEIFGKRYETRAGFSHDLNMEYGLLGQQGFFDYWRVVFDFPDLDISPK